MKKLLNSLKFIGKASLLILLLVFGWAFVNITNLVKGKKTAEKSGKMDGIWGIPRADADAPDCAIGCPQVAYFDGQKFVIENDFLPGDFLHIPYGFAAASRLFNARPHYPDLLKFSAVPKQRNGKLILRLEEMELEESFINWISFIRVIHPSESEVIIDSVTKDPQVFLKKDIEKNLHLPSSVISSDDNPDLRRFNSSEALWENPPEETGRHIFQKGESVEFIFRNLRPDSNSFLLIKSSFRDWMAGETPPFMNFGARIFSYNFVKGAALATLAPIFLKKGLGGYAMLLPLVLGAGTQSKSIEFSYKDASGKYRPLTIHKPRAFRSSLESIALPPGAIQKDGSLTVRASFTKRHSLSFIGVVQEAEPIFYKKETLPIKNAIHSRLGEISGALSEAGAGPTHMIPGDTIEVEFGAPQSSVPNNWKETYLFQSSGFYTQIRPEYRKLAGNWIEKLTPEAKTHLEKLTELSSYR